MATDNGSFVWPGAGGGGSGSNASVGLNGTTAPTSSTEIGGIAPGGNLTPVAVDTAGQVKVVVDSTTPVSENVAQWGGTATTLGQKLMASSVPVAIASDNGIATSALQTTGNTSVASIDTKTPALGQALMAASSPVVIASNQSAIPISATSLPLPTGGSTSALQSSTQGTVAAGTAATASTLTGGVYNTSLPTLTNTQQAATQLDSSGRQIIAPLTNTSVVKAQLQDNAGTAVVLGQAAAASSLPVTLSNENVQNLSFIGQAAQTATVNNIIPSAVSANATDLTGYRSASVQIICPAGTYTTGAIIFEGANDSASGTNFQTIPVWNQITATGTPLVGAITLVTTTSIVYTFPVTTRYARVRISTAVSGASASVQAVSTFSQSSWSPGFTQIAQATAANLNATVTATNLSTNISQINAVTPLMGAGPTGTGSLRETIANIATATTANVAGSATSVTLLASAAARLGAAFYNDSTAILYLKWGATASSTSYTVQIPPNGYYELPGPHIYSGIIDGIWASAAGNARVTST